MAQPTFNLGLKMVAQSVEQQTRRLQITLPREFSAFIKSGQRAVRVTPTFTLRSGLRLSFFTGDNVTTGRYAVDHNAASGLSRINLPDLFLGAYPNRGLTAETHVIAVWYAVDQQLVLAVPDRFEDRAWPTSRVTSETITGPIMSGAESALRDQLDRVERRLAELREQIFSATARCEELEEQRVALKTSIAKLMS